MSIVRKGLILTLMCSIGLVCWCVLLSYWAVDDKADLRDPNPIVRSEAILHLLSTKQPHRAIPGLIDCLADRDPRVRSNAILALNTVGTAALSHLTHALSTKNCQVLVAALQVCGYPDPRYERGFSRKDDQTLMPYLLQYVRDPDDEVRTTAVVALTWVCLGAGEEPTGIRALCDSLSDQSKPVQKAAAHSLARIARYTKDPAQLDVAVGPLQKHLDDKSNDVSGVAKWALDEIRKRENRR
jgi:HEAT repeat protein